MPRYYFDIKDGHRRVDPLGTTCKSDEDAIAKARVVAIQVSLDTPRTDPKRHISVLDAGKSEIFRVPVYSKLGF